MIRPSRRRQHIQGRADPGQQKYGRDRELNCLCECCRSLQGGHGAAAT